MDRSARDIEQARACGLYAGLDATVDPLGYLRWVGERFDLVVAGDVGSLGPLGGVSACAAGALRPGGRFVFVLDHDDGAAEPTADAVARAVTAAGLVPEIRPAYLRLREGREGREPVEGVVVKATKRRGISHP